MLIKHLVLSGGGPTMIQTFGAIQHLEKNSIIQRENIQSIYGTSAGALIGVIYCFKFDWETMYDYIIKRPWHEVFPIKIQNIFDAYTKKGLFDIKTIIKCFKPLLNAKDLEFSITLKEFYEFSKIELHLFAFELNKFHMIDISYKTHPDLSLLVAIQMTCALPILVTPVCLNDCCYIDGGVQCNYPLKFCLDNHNIDEILGFKNNYIDHDTHNVNAQSTLLDFIMNFLFKILFSINTDNKQPKIPFEVVCDTKHMSIEYLKKSLSNEEIRKELFDNGVNSAEHFIKQNKQNEEPKQNQENREN